MPTFTIYHPVDTSEGLSMSSKSSRPFTFNWQKSKTIPFIKVAEVEATDLNDAWEHAQNGVHEEPIPYEMLNIRSTAVGDIIQDPEGVFHFVEGSGFSILSNPTIV